MLRTCWWEVTRRSQWEELYVCYITMCFYPPCFWHLVSGFEVRPFSRGLTEHVCVLRYRCADKHNLKHKVQGLYCQIQNLETGGDWHLSVYPQGFKELQLRLQRIWADVSLIYFSVAAEAEWRWWLQRQTAAAREPLTVTAISSPVTTVRLLTTLWDTESTREPPRGVVYSCPYAFKNHKHTSTKCGIFTAVNHLSSLRVLQCNYLAIRSFSPVRCAIFFKS